MTDWAQHDHDLAAVQPPRAWCEERLSIVDFDIYDSACKWGETGARAWSGGKSVQSQKPSLTLNKVAFREIRLRLSP